MAKYKVTVRVYQSHEIELSAKGLSEDTARNTAILLATGQSVEYHGLTEFNWVDNWRTTFAEVTAFVSVDR